MAANCSLSLSLHRHIKHNREGTFLLLLKFVPTVLFFFQVTKILLNSSASNYLHYNSFQQQNIKISGKHVSEEEPSTHMFFILPEGKEVSGLLSWGISFGVLPNTPV